MDNFENIAKKLKSLSSEDSYYTVDTYSGNILKKSYMGIYNSIVRSTYPNTDKNYLNYKLIRDFLTIYENKVKALSSYELEEQNKFYEKMVETYNVLLNKSKFISDLNAKVEKNKKLISGLISENSLNYVEKENDYGKVRVQKMKMKAEKISAKNIIFQSEIDDFSTEANNFVININKLFNIYKDIERNYKRRLNDAEIFVKANGKSDLSNFLSKQIDIDAIWNFTKSQQFEEVIFFKDDSIAFKEKGEYKTIDPYEDNYNNLSKDINSCVVEYLFRKNQSYIPEIKNLIELDSYNIEAFKTMSDTFFRNEQILKNNGFNLKSIIVECNQTPTKRMFEKIDDSMHKIIEVHKINSLANSILSNKYKHLCDEKSMELFKEIYEFKIDSNILQEYIGKKMASFKTSEDLNSGLSLFINKINNFNMDSLKDKINISDLAVRIVVEDQSLLILEVQDYESCKEFGSGSWCIVRDRSHFESYTGNDAKQYIIYDFTKSSNDINSMIGFTLTKKGEVSTAHKKNDRYVDLIQENEYLYLKTLSVDYKLYNLSEDLKSKLKISNKAKSLKM